MSTGQSIDVGAVRKDFPILDQRQGGKRLVFLDSAASSQRPRQVLDAMNELYESSYANVHRGVYQLAERATNGYEGAQGRRWPRSSEHRAQTRWCSRRTQPNR